MYLSPVPDPALFFDGVVGLFPQATLIFWKERRGADKRTGRREMRGVGRAVWEVKTDSHQEMEKQPFSSLTCRESHGELRKHWSSRWF